MKNLKALMETRADLLAQLTAITEKADTETRAVSDEERSEFDGLEKKVKDIDATIKMEERARSMEKKEAKPEKTEERAEDIEARAFENYIKGQCGVAVEQRADEQNFTVGNNGAVIPTTIVNRIIKTIKDICPIFSKATMFAVKGTLKIPVYGLSNTTHDITVGYQTEFTDITADAGQFTSVDLTGYLAGALTLIGKSVITNSEINVLDFVIAEMSSKIAIFLEGELLNGTSTKATGALATTNTVNAGSVSAITADNLIDLQAKIKQAYQAGACWTMAPATFTAIRKLKYADGKYITQDSFTGETPFMLLGKPVYISDNMPAIGSAAKAVLYGDYSGLGVNMRQNIEIQVLNEKYATAHAVGIVSWFEFDSNVIDAQKLATLVMSV
ncbi:MAG: phage major capsid protein [Prevotella sp.]